MKNVTITLEEEVARWARIRAAERDTSLSRLVGDMLREKMQEDAGYKRSERQFFSQAPRRLRRQGVSLPQRDAVHDRPRLR